MSGSIRTFFGETADYPDQLVFEVQMDGDNYATRIRTGRNVSQTSGIRFYGVNLNDANFIYKKSYIGDMKTLPDCMSKSWVRENYWSRQVDDDHYVCAEGVCFETDIGVAVVTVENSDSENGRLYYIEHVGQFGSMEGEI